MPEIADEAKLVSLESGETVLNFEGMEPAEQSSMTSAVHSRYDQQSLESVYQLLFYNFKINVKLPAAQHIMAEIDEENTLDAASIDIYRRKNKIEFTSMAEDENIETDDNDVEDFVVKKEFFEKLYEAIEMLDEEYKEILKLRLLYDYDYKKIAEIVNISNENVRVKFHRAKKMLLEYLKEANLYGKE